jgi:23S rRNA (uracil1939-C5)-methyltransferase
MNQPSKQPAVGDILTIDILDAGEGNRSFARLGNQMGAFVQGVHVPGDRIQARVTKVKKRLVELTFLKLLSPSPDRIDPPCHLFGSCGGCRWQQLRYERQLELKRKSVQDALQRLGGFRDVLVQPVRPSDRIYDYRNKVDLVFSRKQADSRTSRQWSLGFHEQGSSQTVLNVETCHLISPLMNRVAQEVRT